MRGGAERGWRPDKEPEEEEEEVEKVVQEEATVATGGVWLTAVMTAV